MLKKLLKYDLKNIFKLLIIFYILALFFAILTRIFSNIENSFIIDVIGKICFGTTISMLFSILINNLMRVWIYFKNNLYGDESYLTHTLPVEKKTLYLSKIFTAIITLLISILIMGIVLFIIFYSKENIKMLKDILLPIANTKLLLASLFIFFLEFANILQSGYTGIILGNRMNNTKTGFSVLFGFGTYTITQIFVLLLIFTIAIFNKDIMNLFFTSNMINVEMLKNIIYITISVYTITFIGLYFVNLNLLKKGVNVD
jgi:hypothetical protein